MYTIGQVSDITGISKDRLRYYEVKGILKPKKNETNNYREYNFNDIDTVLLIEFYRTMDLSIDTIREICLNCTINDIELIAKEKEIEIKMKLEELNLIKNNLNKFRSDCEVVRRNLNKYSIKEMPALYVHGEIEDFRSYGEFNKIHKMNYSNKKEATLRKLTRKIVMDGDKQVASSMLITGDCDQMGDYNSDDVISPGKCIYTVVEDSYDGEDIVKRTYEGTLKYMIDSDLKITGECYINMLLIGQEEAEMKSYLEVYIPLVQY
ncbi:MAG: MerR family transcriptional regulator [Clostridiales bacterium]|nr:MerR family transcriptional regulator [Clostridiales bacterium]